MFRQPHISFYLITRWLCTPFWLRSLLCRRASTAQYPTISSNIYFQNLVVGLVLSKLDYGNATLVGLPANLPNRLQSVLNAAARSIAGLRCSAHITDTLASFHWSRAPKWIQFKLAVIVYRVLHGTAPRYLSDRLSRIADMPSSSVFGRQLPTNLLSVRRVLSQSAINHLLLLPKVVEQSSEWHYIWYITDSVSTKTENTFISAVISGRYYVTYLWLSLPWWS